ncbi:MAG: alanine racemase [Clostridia bacterium]|nr:alanine racemase [Clostridia bacterium]
MENFRPTKAVIDLGAIKRNTTRLIEKYKGYQYYMAVVKADCYGYRGFDVVRAMLDGGANCLAASLLEEGLALREHFPNTPILLFTPVPLAQLEVMRDNSLWATVATQKQAEAAAAVEGLQVVIRANGGSDILGGPTTPAEFHNLWNTLTNGKCSLKGIYLHSYNAECAEDTANEYATFENMTAGLPLESLELVSISNSLTFPRYGKKDYANACRLGNIVYKIESEDTDLENTFSLTSRVLNVFTLKEGQSVAYSRAYTATKDNTRIASVPIGFGDGFSKTNIGRDVFINGKRYPIVAVTMDITHLLVDEAVCEDDEVVLIKDTHHLDEIARHIHGATEEAICALNKRVTREYVD